MCDSGTSVSADFARIPDARKLVVIQRNPTSGSGRGAKQLLILIRELRRSGYRVRLFADRERFDSFVETVSATTSIRCLVAAGGDGTIASLASRHSQFPIATLPMGTENLMARHLHISKCGTTVAQLIARGLTRRFDTAFINDQRFLIMASIGVDSEVVRRLHAARRGNIRHLSYVKPILLSFLRYTFPRLSVYSADGELLAEGSHVIAANIPEYGFRMPFCPKASADDGALDIRVFQRFGRFATMWHAVRTWMGFSDSVNELIRFQADEIEVRSTAPSTAAQFDGDPAGSCPVRIAVSPASMTLLVNESTTAFEKQHV